MAGSPGSASFASHPWPIDTCSLQSVAVTAENYSGRIELVAGLTLPDGRGERRPLTVTRDLATVIVLAPETSVAMATGSAVQPKAEATKSRQRAPDRSRG